jgi:hypothetical protein
VQFLLFRYRSVVYSSLCLIEAMKELRMSDVKITGRRILDYGFTGQLLEERNHGRGNDERIRTWESKYHRFQNMLSGRDLVVALGSAGSKVVSKTLEEFSNHLFRGYVDNGIASGTGHADSGYMLVVAREVIRAWDGDEKRAFKAPLFGVPLLFQGSTTEQKFRPTKLFPEIEWLHDPEKRRKAVICSPGHLTLHTRTPCLIGHEKLAAQLYYPGGWGTTEELATSGVGHQLKDGIASCHNGAKYRPLRFLLDDTRFIHGKIRWFYQGMIEHLYNMDIFGTVEEDTVADFHAIRIDGTDRTEKKGPITIKYFKNPESAATFVLTQTLQNIQ